MSHAYGPGVPEDGSAAPAHPVAENVAEVAREPQAWLNVDPDTGVGVVHLTDRHMSGLHSDASRALTRGALTSLLLAMFPDYTFSTTYSPTDERATITWQSRAHRRARRAEADRRAMERMLGGMGERPVQ